MLTAAKIRNVSKPGVYTDGPGRYGLALLVKAGAYSIRKTFVQRMTIAGKRTNIGLGKVEFVTLAEARRWAFENARANARGEPLPHGGKRRGGHVVRTIPTFREAADQYIALQAAGWKAGSRNEANWRSSLAHAAPIMDRPVDSVATDDVVGIVVKLLRAGKALADRTRCAPARADGVRLVHREGLPHHESGQRRDRRHPAEGQPQGGAPGRGRARRDRRGAPQGRFDSGADMARGQGRVPLRSPDRGSHVGSSGGEVERDRPRRGRVDHPRGAHEGGPGPSGAVVHRGALRAQCGP